MKTGETSGADLATGFILSLLRLKPEFNPYFKQGAQYAS